MMISHHILEADFPIYTCLALSNGSIIFAGGGGASRTGVPNEIEVIDFTRKVNIDNLEELKPYELQIKITTGPNAIMSMKLLSSFCATTNVSTSNLISIQANKIIESSVVFKEDKISANDLKMFEIEDETPSVIDVGPPGASWCTALGTEKGHIYIVETDKTLTKIVNPSQKNCRVFSLSFSPVLNKDTKKAAESSCLPPSFLAAIHERPDGESLRVFKLTCDIQNDMCLYKHSLHTDLSVSELGVQNVLPKKNMVVKSRFKHCQFLNWHRPSNSSASARRALLVATVMPISVNSQFFSQLVVYCIEYDKNQAKPSWLVTMIHLPKGQLPSCLVTHPSSNTALIGLGTIDGDVSVYQFLPQKQCLVQTFHVTKAHSIFVTNLTFLPSRERSQCGSLLKKGKNQSVEEEESSWCASSLYYELVTVSADRNLCWHSGPSFAQIAENTSRQDDFLPCSSIKTIDNFSNLFCLLFVMFAPLFIASLDKLLSFFF